MKPQMFAIVLAGEDSSVFSYGIDTGDEAFTFRRDPQDGRTLFSVHDNADRALVLANRITKGLAELELLRFPITEPLYEDDDEDEDDPEAVERPARSGPYVPQGFSIEDSEDIDDGEEEDEG